MYTTFIFFDWLILSSFHIKVKYTLYQQLLFHNDMTMYPFVTFYLQTFQQHQGLQRRQTDLYCYQCFHCIIKAASSFKLAIINNIFLLELSPTNIHTGLIMQNYKEEIDRNKINSNQLMCRTANTMEVHQLQMSYSIILHIYCRIKACCLPLETVNLTTFDHILGCLVSKAWLNHRIMSFCRLPHHAVLKHPASLNSEFLCHHYCC